MRMPGNQSWRIGLIRQILNQRREQMNGIIYLVGLVVVVLAVLSFFGLG